jgi:hypothetical protein
MTNGVPIDLRKSLGFEHMHAREEQIALAAERACEDTFDWILSHNIPGLGYSDTRQANVKGSFLRWLYGKSALFWISGKPGSGKSTLMRKIYHDSRLRTHLESWAPSRNVTLATMFFTSQGTVLERSREGLLRSLLYQALVDPALCMQVLEPFLDKTPENVSYDITKFRWTWGELRSAFSKLLQIASHAQCFCFLVDGLDEYNVATTTDDYPQDHYLESGSDSERCRKIRAGYLDIAELLQSYAGNEFVKICVSSRPYNEFGSAFSDCPSFSLHDLTGDDVHQFVSVEIGKRADASHVTDYSGLVDDITTMASGVFLWVKIATGIVVDCIINEEDPAQVKSTLAGLPTALGGSRGLYMRMLKHLDAKNRALAWKSFDIVLHAQGTLSAVTLAFAIEADPSRAVRAPIELLSGAAIDRHCMRLGRRLKASGGFLEIVDTRYGKIVRFIHLTAREFISRRDNQLALTSRNLPDAIDPNVALLTACLLQLKSLQLDGSGTHGELCESTAVHKHHVGDLDHSRYFQLGLWKSVFEGLYYAVAAEETTELPQTALLDELDRTVHRLWKECEPDPRCFAISYQKSRLSQNRHWMQALPRAYIDSNPVYYWKDDFMSLAVRFNLVLYLAEKVEDGYQFDEKQGRPLLAYAVVCRPWEMSLQDMLGVKLSRDFSRTSVTKLLLRHGADLNAVYKYEFGLDQGNDGSRCWGFLPSIWQLSLVSVMCCVDDSIPELPKFANWWRTMETLLHHGAPPNASVCVQETRSELCFDAPQEKSALFFCMYICMQYFDCNSSLPRLVIAKGGRLQQGELDSLILYANSGLFESFSSVCGRKYTLNKSNSILLRRESKKRQVFMHSFPELLSPSG